MRDLIRRIATRLRQAAQAEEDKGNLWLASVLSSLADRLEGKHRG